MRRLAFVLGLVSVVALTGCNTVKGVGKDVQKGGEAVTQTATEVQQKM
ncbi:entericidin A/B family lipoprotein [Rappaport israeli]|nr:entericidin A/B family lipoprotein [Rappaport israeli]